jgi:hypothetical protein
MNALFFLRNPCNSLRVPFWVFCIGHFHASYMHRLVSFTVEEEHIEFLMVKYFV